MTFLTIRPHRGLRLSAGLLLLAGALIGLGPLHPAPTQADQPSRATVGGFYVDPALGRTTLAAHALDLHTGTIKGEFEQQYQDAGFAVHGTVDCLCIFPAPNGVGAV